MVSSVIICNPSHFLLRPIGILLYIYSVCNIFMVEFASICSTLLQNFVIDCVRIGTRSSCLCDAPFPSNLR